MRGVRGGGAGGGAFPCRCQAGQVGEAKKRRHMWSVNSRGCMLPRGAGRRKAGQINAAEKMQQTSGSVDACVDRGEEARDGGTESWHARGRGEKGEAYAEREPGCLAEWHRPAKARQATARLAAREKPGMRWTRSRRGHRDDMQGCPPMK